MPAGSRYGTRDPPHSFSPRAICPHTRTNTHTGWDSDFLTYASGYLNHPNPVWGTLDNVSPAGIKRLAIAQLSIIVAAPHALLGAAWRALIVGWLLLGTISVRSILKRQEGQAVRIGLLIWFFGLALFFLWWFPTEPEFHVLLLPPLLLLSFFGMHELAGIGRVTVKDGSRLVLLSSLVVLLAVCNFPGASARTTDRGAWYRNALALNRAIGDVDLVYTDARTIAVMQYYLHRNNGFKIDVIQLLFLDGNDRALQPFRIQPRSYAIALNDVMPDVFQQRRQQSNVAVRKYLLWLFDIHESSNILVHRHFDLVRIGSGSSMLLFGGTLDTLRHPDQRASPFSGLPVRDSIFRNLGVFQQNTGG